MVLDGAEDLKKPVGSSVATNGVKAVSQAAYSEGTAFGSSLGLYQHGAGNVGDEHLADAVVTTAVQTLSGNK